MNSVYSIIFSIFAAAVLLTGCAGTDGEAQTDEASRDERRAHPDRGSSNLEVSFRTQRGALTYTVNPYDEDVYIEMTGDDPQGSLPDSGTGSERADRQKQNGADMKKENLPAGGDAQLQDTDQDTLAPEVTERVIALIRSAQEAFYDNRYTDALDKVNMALGLSETAEAHALKGSIYYMMGQSAEAAASWERALQLNPDMPGVREMLTRQ
ncbi:MAG: tetratricopeptide repeat protein [Fibrobacterota bacterium]